MKILYLANIRLPTEKAHGIQIMNTCSALAGAGTEVELIVPSRKNTISENPFGFYGLPKNFTITTLSCPDLVRLGKIGGMVQAALFSFWTAWYVLLHSNTHDILYSRHESLLLLPSFIRKNIFWESHTGKSGRSGGENPPVEARPSTSRKNCSWRAKALSGKALAGEINRGVTS